MKMARRVLVVGVAAVLSEVAAGKAPHVLFLLADDFGWHNSGHRGDVDSPEVVTPNLRALTQQGLLLNRHYAYKICSPTRCSLQTGKLARCRQAAARHEAPTNPRAASISRRPLAGAREPVQRRARIVQPAGHRVWLRRHPAQPDRARRATQGGLVRDGDDGKVRAVTVAVLPLFARARARVALLCTDDARAGTSCPSRA